MKRIMSLSFIMVSLIFFQIQAKSPVEKFGQLSVEGNRVIGSNGEPAQLRGMSFFWSQWSEQYWNSSVVDWLVDDWKATLVRAAMGVETMNPEDPAYLSDKTQHKTMVKTIVDAAIENGIYVIIDWHDHNAHSHESEAIQFFEEMARDYGDYPNVIYEIFNEPTDISWSETVKPYSETVIDAIREIDPDNLIIVGTPKWCQDVHIAAADPIDKENIVYSLHYYAASHQDSLRDLAQQALDLGIPLFASEFGTCEYTGDGYVDEAETEEWFAFKDENHISWANWSINDKAESASALNGGASASGNWSESDLTQSGLFIRNKLREYGKPTATDSFSVVRQKAGEGTLSLSPEAGLYQYNSQVSITATPDDGWVFLGWSGDLSGTENPATVTMDSDKKIVANFTQQSSSSTSNLLTNGDFENGETPWNFLASGAQAQGSVTDGEYETEVSSPGSENWNVQFTQSVGLEQGKTYRLSFRARAQSPRSIEVNVGQDGGAFASYMGATQVELTTSMETYMQTFTMSSPTDENARVEFNSGTESVTWYLDDVTLEEVNITTKAIRSRQTVSPWSVSVRSNELVIRSPKARLIDAALFNIRGREVTSFQSRRLSNGKLTLAISEFPAGNYILKVRDRITGDLAVKNVAVVK
ncbi:MAG: cellulase family glycosylhydrolase [Chitinispirillaceae bacterium]